MVNSRSDDSSNEDWPPGLVAAGMTGAQSFSTTTLQFSFRLMVAGGVPLPRAAGGRGRWSHRRFWRRRRYGMGTGSAGICERDRRVATPHSNRGSLGPPRCYSDPEWPFRAGAGTRLVRASSWVGGVGRCGRRAGVAGACRCRASAVLSPGSWRPARDGADGYSSQAEFGTGTTSGGCTTRRPCCGVTVAFRCRCAMPWAVGIRSATIRVVADPVQVDIHHVAPLTEARRSGVETRCRRRGMFAKDLDHPQPLAVTVGVNRATGDQDPAQWFRRIRKPALRPPVRTCA